ncbi:hypothetical protein SO802_013326 [Lithocarpus litseifolius]|uniref:Uncharacterized protein n=1 Tax=Lithocarpus litseifolius TaxID=425828 RepID=A0AAW2D8Z1_9ROSI
MIPKSSFYILFILTFLFIVVLLLVPIWTMMGRATRSVIMSLFVIMIRVSGKKGSKCFPNPTQFLLVPFPELLIVFMKLLSLFTKLVELSPSEYWVFDVVTAVIVVVVTVSLVSHQTRRYVITLASFVLQFDYTFVVVIVSNWAFLLPVLSRQQPDPKTQKAENGDSYGDR